MSNARPGPSGLKDGTVQVETTSNQETGFLAFLKEIFTGEAAKPAVTTHTLSKDDIQKMVGTDATVTNITASRPSYSTGAANDSDWTDQFNQESQPSLLAAANDDNYADAFNGVSGTDEPTLEYQPPVRTLDMAA